MPQRLLKTHLASLLSRPGFSGTGNIREESRFVVRPMRLVREKEPPSWAFSVLRHLLSHGKGVCVQLN